MTKMNFFLKTLLLMLPLLFGQTAHGDINSDLIEAAEDGDAAKVENFIKQGADVNAKGEGGGTALMWAAGEGHAEIVKTLIAEGADVNTKSEDGVTALMWAAGAGHAEIVKTLIAKGADVNVSVSGRRGWVTPRG
jgi:ankyrin repeat protein